MRETVYVPVPPHPSGLLMNHVAAPMACASVGATPSRIRPGPFSQMTVARHPELDWTAGAPRVVLDTELTTHVCAAVTWTL